MAIILKIKGLCVLVLLMMVVRWGLNRSTLAETSDRKSKFFRRFCNREASWSEGFGFWALCILVYLNCTL